MKIRSGVKDEKYLGQNIGIWQKIADHIFQ
jgi:hypothetical protein